MAGDASEAARGGGPEVARGDAAAGAPPAGSAAAGAPPAGSAAAGAPPAGSAAAARLSARLAALAAALRARGVRAGVGELLAAHRALAAVDAGAREQAYFALRATLCSSRADHEPFALAFADVFGPHATPPEEDPFEALGTIARAALPRVEMPGDEPAVAELDAVPAAWSEEELLRTKDFAQYTDAQRAAARRLLARLALRGPTRRSRRTRAARHRGHLPDLRATTRASLRQGGELLERRWRVPTTRPRRLVLVLDVSGSMAPYARVLLQYVQASVAARARVEAFAFGTHLTRITLELAGRDPDHALRRAADHVTDWSGGTRIGASLATLNREHGRRIGRGGFVVLLSDGWDRGDPEELSAELGRLRRTAYRLVWLNPLAADPRFEPLTRGMQAAMPHLDRLLPGNTIASLEQLADLMEGELA
jgi:uncharacterized protein with von Willebrand factor type A (vWA) domain